MTMRWTVGINGFGIGLWRNGHYPGQVIWTLAVGPITVHASFFRRAAGGDTR